MKSLYSTLHRVKSGIVAAAVFVALGSASLNAQVSAYTFTQTTGTYTPITGGTVLGTATNDDVIFSALNIGFPFCFNGTTYTQFGVNSNGWIYMGGAVGASSYTALSTGSTNNVIAGFNFDLQGEPTTGDLRYQTIGTAPNRTLVVQFTNYDAWSSTSNSNNYNFQIRLNEGTNVVDVVYGSFSEAGFRFPQVGLRGNSNADFNTREVVNGLNTWPTSNPGATNSVTCEINSTLLPTSGLTYTWSPGPPPAPPINFTFSSVTPLGMTLNWEDNSTNEIQFVVYRSTDNVTFTQVGTVTSTSTATTGTPYNYVATGLSSNTLYYWRVEAVTSTCGSAYVSGQQSTSPGTMCGTYTIGPTGAYTSLTAAVAAVATNGILCPLVFEFQAAYVSTVETFPINIPFLGTSAANTITCRPELGATNIIITSTAAQTINFTGAAYFTFDGRPGGVGTNRELSIENASTTGIAMQFTNDVQFCGINYVNVRGVNTSTIQGVVVFGNAVVGGVGNSNNTFQNSQFTSGLTRATHLVYASNSTANVFNTNNVFNNNNFFDYGSGTTASSAFTVTGGNAAWVITNNSFYQTTTRTFTSAVTHWGININTTTANTGGYNISGNYVGGTAPLCGGTNWTDASTTSQRFIAINVTTGTGTANSIQGNTITKFTFSTSSTITTTNGIWCGIMTTGTSASHNIGTITGNMIGSTTVNGQITTSTSGSGGMTAGICNTASGAINISNNMIGGITANSSSTTVSSSINGINSTTGSSVTISGNTVGSTTSANSLINAVSTGATSGQITGIQCAAFAVNTISNNTISNLTSQYAGTSTLGQVRGIVVTSGSNNITGNTISALSTMANHAGTTTVSSVLGISCQSASALGFQTISGNTIIGLANGNTTAASQITGILATSSTTVGNTFLIHKNTIRALGSPLTTGASVTHGIQIYGGTGRVYNNMIGLGLDPLGAPSTQNKEFNGITKNTANRLTVAFNTVSIDGAGVVAGTANTYGFRRLASPVAAPADSVFSNIFSNTRSNGAGTGIHYAIGLNNTTNFVANANNYYGNGTGYMMGFDGTASYATVSAWTGATAQDANSFGVNPMFTSTTNLHISNPGQTPLESRAIPMGINVDIDNDVRPGPVGSVNGGGTVPDIGADEFDGFPVTVDLGVQALLLPATTGCHGSSDTVRVRIRNYSTVTLNMAINNVTVNASVTGPNPMVFAPVVITSGTLAPAATMDVTIVTNYNMSAVGTYVFSASTSQVNDVVTSNDAMANVSINVSGGTATVVPSPQCVGSGVTLTVAGQTNGGSIQWQSSPDNVTWTNIPGATTTPYSTTATDTTYYRAVICGLHNSTVDTVVTIFVNDPVVEHDTICGLGTVNLIGNGSGVLNWYSGTTGGMPVYSGDTLTMAITSTDTMYVANSFTSYGSGSLTTPTCYPVYTSACSSADFINNFATTGGITNITNNGTGCNGTLPSNTTFFPSQIHTTTPGSTVNFTCQSGPSWSQGFRMWVDFNNDGDFADPGEDVWASATSSTALQSGSFVVPVSTAPGPKRIRLMCRFATVPTSTNYCSPPAPNNSFGETEEYTLMVGLLCESNRVPVYGVVTPPPSLNITTASPNYCLGDSVLMVATGGSVDYEYTWTPATNLLSTTGDSVTAVNPVGNYTYYVDALDSITGCANRDTISYTMNMNPSVIASAAPNVVCAYDSSLITTTVNTVAYMVDTANASNTTTTYPAPYGNWYWGSHHQMLITASELTAAGITAGPITGLSWDITGLTATTLQGFAIRVAHTTQTSLVGFQTAGFTMCVPPGNYTPTLGTNVHTFTTPFVWNGTDNIIIETCFNNASFTTNCVFAQVTRPYNATEYYFADASGICAVPTPNGSSNMRPATTLYAQTTTLNYAWTPGTGLSSPTASDPIATPPATTTYTVVVTDPLTGCTATDTTLISTLPTPMPMLGADTVICSNATLLLDGGNGNDYVYLWQDSTTNQMLTVNAFGNYSVAVTDTLSGCTGRDTILVGVNAAPAFTLGADAIVCSGTQVSFSGPSGQYAYNWNTGDTVVTITTGTQGSYELDVTDTVNGCMSSDTVMLTVNPNPTVALGSDTAVCSSSGMLMLMGPAGNYTYDWSTGDSTQMITVGATGIYSVLVTDTATTCYSSDTITINYNPSPVAALGNDTTFCSANGPITLVGPAGPYNYLWNDMSTGMTLQTNTTGTYYVDVTDTTSGCTATDTVVVNVPATPTFSLTDTSLCGTQYTINGPAGPFGYLWSDMTTGMATTVSASGTYGLTVTDTTSGCSAVDSATINLNSDPTVTASASSMTPCADDANVILTGSPAGGMFFGTSVSGNQFDPSVGAGTYAIIYNYTDPNGCAGSDTLSIVVNACVGITEPFVQAGMNVYPNPNNGVFTFTAADMNCEKMIIEIMTVDGQVVRSEQHNNVQGNFTTEIDMDEFANGTYLMRVITDGAVYTQRIIKQD